MSFVGAESWILRYQRNNKQSGLKNIRCFPECSKPHRLRGFCGSSITFQLPKTMSESTVFFGEFALKDSVTMSPGDIVTPAEIGIKERIDDLFKPWFRGEVADERTVVFNKQKKGWHYSWVSNKHTSGSEHVFRVYLLEPAGQGNLRCVSVVDSPAFTIFCRRRDKSGVERLPPQFACHVKQSSSEGDEEEEDDEVDEEEEEEEEDERPKRKRASVNTRSTTKRQTVEKKSKLDVSVPVSTRGGLTSSSISTPAQIINNPSSTLIQSSTRMFKVPSQADDSAIVFRILAALTNVHDRQVDAASSNANQTNQSAVSGAETSDTAAGQVSSSSSFSFNPGASNVMKGISTPNTPSTSDASEDPDFDLFDISKAINECWDWVSPTENLGDTQFFDSFFAQPSAKPVEEMLLRLGQYLLKEDFTKEIEEVFANKAAGAESKKQVVTCLRGKFQKFFQREGTTLERFDKDLMAQNPQLTEEKSMSRLLFPSPATHAFQNPLPLENIFRAPFRVIPGGPHDFTGHWRRPSSTLETLEKLRSIIGFSWLERKLMFQMESEFFVWFEGNTMFVRGQRKLAGSNSLIHIIDGVDYPFAQPSVMLVDTLALGLFNRTWATDDGALHFLTTYTLQYRTLRSTKRSSCGNRLESTVTLQKNELNQLPGIWTDVFSFPAHAERVINFNMVGKGE